MKSEKYRNRKTRKTRKNRNQKIRENKRKSGAGLFSFGKEVSQNIIFKEKKPKKFNTLKKNTKYNKTYETLVTPDSGKTYTVFFITPQTLVFNNTNSTRVPTFIVNKKIQNLKIENRYINYLVRIEGVWYAILRIVFALNTSFFASYTYTIFYELNNGVIQFDENENDITIKSTYYETQKEFTLGFFKDDTESMVLKETAYKAITKNSGDIFYALRKFRNVQLESFYLKQEALYTAADTAVNTAIDIGF